MLNLTTNEKTTNLSIGEQIYMFCITKRLSIDITSLSKYNQYVKFDNSTIEIKQKVSFSIQIYQLLNSFNNTNPYNNICEKMHHCEQLKVILLCSHRKYKYLTYSTQLTTIH
jgi:hypothetical protein